MPLTFLGIGSAFYPALGNTSAYFLKEDTLYLIDCGSTVFSALVKAEILTKVKEIVVYISHCHCDHVGSLGTLISYCKYVTKQKITVVHPEKNLSILLKTMGIQLEDYCFLQMDKGVVKGVEVAFYQVSHSQNIGAYGFTLSFNENTLYYSGDAAQIPQEILEGFYQGKIQNIYQDTSFMNEKPKGHGSYQELQRSIPLALRSKVYPIHWDYFAKEEIIKEGFALATICKK